MIGNCNTVHLCSCMNRDLLASLASSEDSLLRPYVVEICIIGIFGNYYTVPSDEIDLSKIVTTGTYRMLIRSYYFIL